MGDTNIQWFPGHMAKTRRILTETVSRCDAVAEILDARIPLSSQNPEIKQIIGNKPHIILLNKSDLADGTVTKRWIEYFKKKGIVAVAIDSKNSNSLNNFKSAVLNMLKEKTEANAVKGMGGKKMKIMVVGIPNVGKSSFINKLCGVSKAKAENRPGVTRSNQWFTVDDKIEILDTPGVLWPKFDDKKVGENLAFTGAVTDRILDIETLAVNLIGVLKEDYADNLISRYGELDFECENYEVLEQISKARGMVIKGGEIDYERASNMLLDEFRNARIGKISLERPNDYA